MVSAFEISLLRVFEKRIDELRDAEKERLLQKKSLSSAPGNSALIDMLKSATQENKREILSTSDVPNQPPPKRGKWIESNSHQNSDEIQIPLSQNTPVEEVSAFVTRESKESSAFVPREKAAFIKSTSLTSDTTLTPATSILTGTSKAIAKSQKILDLDDMDDSEIVSDPNTLFSPAGIIFQDSWNSRLSSAVDLNLLLPNFSFYPSSSGGNQTLALQIQIPEGSIGWSLSICPASQDPTDNTHLTDALFHFNPRYNKQMLVMTDRLGTWGTEVRRSLGKDSREEAVLAKRFELMIQIREEGFVVFANGVYCDYFVHRRPLAPKYEGRPLRLVMYVVDGNGMRHGVNVRKVWWGERDPALNPLAANIQSALASAHESFLSSSLSKSNPEAAASRAQRSLVVTGLPLSSNLVENYEMEKPLKGLFESFEWEAVQMVPGQGMAFIRLSRPESVAAAVEELDGAVIEQKDEQLTLHMAAMSWDPENP